MLTRSNSFFRALFIFCVLSQTTGVADEAQLWTQWLTQAKITSDLRIWAEVQPRYGFSTNGLTTILSRPGIGWQATPELSLWLGYAWTPLVRPSARDEHRIWTQASLALTAGDVKISQRLRIEARSIERSSPVAYRLRYMARAAIPLAQDGPLSAVIYDEVFLALNAASPAVAAGFDQNRLFLGINHRLSSALTADFGYLWNAINSPSPQPPRSNHVIMLTFFHSLN
jgi:hypothetical protein